MGIFFTGTPGGPNDHLSWVRVVVAAVLLVILMAAAIYTAYDPKLGALHTSLVHGFEVLLGGVIGLVLGERVARG